MRHEGFTRRPHDKPLESKRSTAGEGHSPFFPRLLNTDSNASSNSSRPGPSPRTLRPIGSSGTPGGDHEFSNLAEYLTKRLDLQRTDSDAAGSELSFASSLSRDSSFNVADIPNLPGRPTKSRKGINGLANMLYSRKLEGIEEKLRQTKESVDKELDLFTAGCRESLGDSDIAESEQFIYASLMEIAESVQALSLDDLRSNAQNVLQQSVNELQILRHRSHGLTWTENCSQSPVMKLVFIVSKLSRVAEQFRPTDSGSPLSSMIMNPQDNETSPPPSTAPASSQDSSSLAAIPMRIFGVDVEMLNSNLTNVSPDGSPGLYTRDSGSEADAPCSDPPDNTNSVVDSVNSPRHMPVQGGGWNLPSQLLVLLPKALRTAMPAEKRESLNDEDDDDDLDTPSVLIPTVPGQAMVERWRQRRALNLKEDLVKCRICEENQKLSCFESHTTLCSLVASSTQQILKINGGLLKFADKIDNRAKQPHQNGSKRSPHQLESLSRLSEICRTPEKFMLKKEDLKLTKKSKKLNAMENFSLPGGLLNEERMVDICNELEELARQADSVRDSLVAQISRRVKIEYEGLIKAFNTLCTKSWETISEKSKTEVESRNEVSDPRMNGRFRKVMVAASLQNSPVLTSIDIGSDSLLPSINDFDVIKPISRGAFGRVYLSKKKTTGDVFAIKTLNKTDMLRKNLVSRVRAEKDILAGVANPFVVRFFWSFQTDNKLFLVMEYLPGGDMYSLLCNLGFLDSLVSRQYIAEIVLAIDYLHKMNIVHRDLKPDNVLIGRDGHIKLTDFGLSRLGLLENNLFQDQAVEPSEEQAELSKRDYDENALKRVGSLNSMKKGAEDDPNEMVGTPDYLAPELLLGQGHSFPVDWWALGVLMYEFFMGIPPFHDSTPENIFENILNGAIEWPVVPDEMSQEALDLLKRLLDPNPKTRIGTKGGWEIREHPFFEGVEWDNVLQQQMTFIPEYSTFDDTSYFSTRVGTTALSMDEEDMLVAKSGAEDGDGSLGKDSLSLDNGKQLDQKQFHDFAFQNLHNLEARNMELLKEMKSD